MANKTVTKTILFMTGALAVAGFAWLAYQEQLKYLNSMPSNEDIFGLTTKDDLTPRVIGIMHRIASVTGYNPAAMAQACAAQVYGFCMQQVADPITLRQVSADNNFGQISKSVDLSPALASGANMTMKVSPTTYKSQEYVDWYNQLDQGISDRLCGSILFKELQHLFTRFVQLVSKNLTDKRVFDVLQSEYTQYKSELGTARAEGFAGTMWAQEMSNFDDYLREMTKSAPEGVIINLSTHTPPKFTI